MAHVGSLQAQGETVDIVILTVIPPELEAARRVLQLDDDCREKDPDGTVYFQGAVRSELAKRDYAIALTCIGSAGNPGAAAATASAIAKYRPRAVLLMGIAAGIRDKIQIGQVVLSDRVVAYEPAALTRTVRGRQMQRRPEIDRVPHTMLQDVVSYRPDSARLSAAFERTGGEIPTAPAGRENEFRAHVASAITARQVTIASGEKLFRDPSKLLAVRDIHGKTEVGEMEAAGVVNACRPGSVPWMVIRGISDFGDELKDDRFHAFASCAAAAVMRDFVTHGVDLGTSSRTTAHVTSGVSKSLESRRKTPAIEDLPIGENNEVKQVEESVPLALSNMDTFIDTFGRDNPFLPSEASIRLFRLLWQLEVWLREMVYVELRSRDVDWQEQIRKVAENWQPRSQASDKRLTHMTTRHQNAISYLTLDELLRVIQSQSNWPLFEAYFPPKDIFEPLMKEISQIRHRIAHFRDPHQSDVDRVVLRLKDLDQGFWRFATSYSGRDVRLSNDASDPVSRYFDETYDQRWLVETMTIGGQWRYNGDGRQPRLIFHIQGSSRPWFNFAGSSLAGQPGFIYHAKFSSLSNSNRFCTDRVLEQTESFHVNCAHIRLETHSLEIMVPSILGKDLVISTIERFLERCIESVSAGSPFDNQRVEKIASEWPEYVLGPTNPLGFLDNEMPCPMFTLD